MCNRSNEWNWGPVKIYGEKVVCWDYILFAAETWLVHVFPVQLSLEYGDDDGDDDDDDDGDDDDGHDDGDYECHGLWW